MIGIGIDTGGTCTDAVVFDITERCILASAKSQTTHDHLEQGIGNSLDKLPKELLHQASFLALSTTQNPDGIFLKWRLRNVSLPMTASPSPR